MDNGLSFFRDIAERVLVFFIDQRGDRQWSKYMLPMLLQKKKIIFSPGKRDSER
jgi:hypothetical protein